MWWLHVYWWLEANNLWKACVAWSVGLALNAAWAIRVWARKQREDRKRHADVMDKLDPNTPGGLGDIKKMMQSDDDGEAPDDNGSDPHRNPSHGGADITHVIRGGDTGAGHR